MSTVAQGLKILRRSRVMTLGLVLVLAVSLLALIAPAVAPFDPLELDPMRRLQPPGPVHRMGTDDVGRDVFSRVLWGSRVSLLVGGLVVIFSNLLGVFAGLVSGYFDRVDKILMRFMDGLMAFPTTLLAIAMMAVLGARLSNVVIALSVVTVPRVARVVRGVVLSVRELPYVEAAVAAGAPTWKIILFHVLPNCLDPIIVQGSFIFAASVLSEAALSFLGVGMPPWVPSWGNIMAGGRMFISVAPWMTLYPGLAIIVFVLGLNLFG
ncbi:MAG TPA: peptide ABC transporter permease, partial [Clostridiales bacterium UBA8153]|nr:peptide ABC transporter permease [Clostridiales bacterium UBA8153]